MFIRKTNFKSCNYVHSNCFAFETSFLNILHCGKNTFIYPYYNIYNIFHNRLMPFVCCSTEDQYLYTGYQAVLAKKSREVRWENIR